MSEEKTTVKSGGIGFLGLLTVLFIGLKLTGFIEWSWWWVLSPLWIPVAMVFGIVTIAGLIIGIIQITAATVDKLKQEKFK